MKITEDEFSNLELIIKKSCIKSKVFSGKLAAMRVVILKVSELRESIVYDETFVENVIVSDSQKSLYDRIGSISGIK